MMVGDKNDPRELAFWQNRLADRTILSALRSYPEHAKDIFGAVPLMRKDVLELGSVLAARRILATPAGQSIIDLKDLLGKELLASIDALPAERRRLCLEKFTPEKQNEFARDWAKMIIKKATGTEPL